MRNTESLYKKEAIKSYILAADLLPDHLWQAAFSIPESLRKSAEEFRLRAGCPMVLTIDGKPHLLADTLVQPSDLEAVLAKVSRCSIHSFDSQLRQGFITAKGGHRVGLCGTYTDAPNGKMIGSLQAINIRIARQYIGLVNQLAEMLYANGDLSNALILAPPGVGKTTLLRDLCRILSARHRISVADCRFELYGEGYDLGFCDVVQGGRKAEAIEMLLRAMSPELIAVDEITAAEDVQTMLEAAHTGVCFLATAHGSGMEDLMRRPLYRRLMEAEIFEKVVLLERTPRGRAYRIFERSETDDKNSWTGHDRHLLLDDGAFHGAGDGAEESCTEKPYFGAAADP